MSMVIGRNVLMTILLLTQISSFMIKRTMINTPCRIVAFATSIFLAVAFVNIASAQTSLSQLTEEKAGGVTFEKQFLFNVFPKDGAAIIGDYHDWIISVKHPNGADVADATILVSGGMIAHGHGLPSKPQVTTYLGEGRYLIEGMLFNMSGDWTLQFVIHTPDKMDRARVDFKIEF